MQELDIGGHRYRTGKLDAFQQFHVFRKLAPLMSGVGESWTMLPAAVEEGEIPPGFWEALGPALDALAAMSTENSEFVIRTCIKTCLRHNDHGQWARVATPEGDLMFEDIDLMTMLNLVSAVVMDNLGNFFGGPLPNGSAGEGSTYLSSSPR